MKSLRIAVLLNDAAALDEAAPLLRALAGRGASLHLAVLDPQMDDARRRLARFCAAHPGATVGHAVGRCDDWLCAAGALRAALAAVAASPEGSGAASEALAGLGLESASRAGALGRLERLHGALPCDPQVLRGLDELDADLVVLTDLERRAGAQADWLLAGRRLGVPVVFHDPQQAKAARAVAAAFQPDALLSAPRDAPPVTAIEAAAAAPWPRRRPALLQRPWLEAIRARLARPSERAPRPGPSLLPVLLRAGARRLSARQPLLAGRFAEAASRSEIARLAAIDAEIGLALAGGGAVVFGPWTGAPDEELLFWIPFLTWLRKERQVDKGRLVAVGQGGKRLWYAASGAQYFDLDELGGAGLPSSAGGLGPGRAAALWRALARRAAERAGAASFGLIGPELMEKLYRPFLSGRAGPAFMDDHTRIHGLPFKPGKLERATADLPKPYVAVQFAAGPAFADTPKNRAAAEAMVLRLAEQTDVLLLASPFWAEAGAADLTEELKHPRVRRTSAKHAADLSAQSLLLAGASGFVGSPGAPAVLAAQLGRASLCLLAEDDAAVSLRLDWARRAFAPLGGRLCPLPLSAAEELGSALQALASPSAAAVDGRLARASWDGRRKAACERLKGIDESRMVLPATRARAGRRRGPEESVCRISGSSSRRASRRNGAGAPSPTTGACAI